MKVFGLLASYLPLREEWSRIVASYGLVPEPDGVNATWHEVEFAKKQYPSPAKEDIRKAIIADINRQTDEKILTGFRWTVLHGADKGKVASVWLSQENQANYKAYHDGAVYYPQVVTLPVTFKIGETGDGAPVYEVFEKKEELSQFYLQVLAYIQTCLEEGWKLKDEVLSRDDEEGKED